MAVKSEYFAGFALGLGAAAVGAVLYIKNRDCIHRFLESHGICTCCCEIDETESLSLEELVAEKERLENIIAEREMADGSADDKPSPLGTK